MPLPACSFRIRFTACLTLGLAGAAVAPSAALAEPPADAPDAEVTSYRFDDDLVRGGVPAPSAEHLYVRTRSDRASLIRVRTHFVHELLRSAEQL